MRLKGTFITQDGGETWLLIRQHFLAELRFEQNFIDGNFQGETFRLVKDTEKKGEQDSGQQKETEG